MNDIALGSILVIAMNLSEVSVFEVRREYLEEVEYFDNDFIGEVGQWNALDAGFGAHIFSFLNDQRAAAARR